MPQMHSLNATAIPGCIRKLNNYERIFYLFPGYSVTLAARIKGSLSESRLRQAIAEAAGVFPLTGAKVVFDENHDAWFSTDNVSPASFRRVERTSDTTWYSEMQAEQKSVFTPQTSPMIRFVLVHSPEVSEIIVICSHAICDGMSLVYLVREILDRCVNPGKETEAVHTPDVSDIFPEVKGFSVKRLIADLYVQYGGHRFNKHPYYFSQEDYEAVNEAFWKKWEYGAALMVFEPEETRELHARCREKDVTLGAVVTAACLAAHEDVAGAFTGNFKVISIPFDLRRHAEPPLGDVFGLCAGTSQLNYTYRSDLSLWENASAIHEEILKRVGKLDSSGRELLGFNPSLLVSTACFALLSKEIPEAFAATANLSRFIKDKKHVAFSFLGGYEKTLPGTISTNLGALPIPVDYGNLSIDSIYFLPPISTDVPLFLGGATIGEKMVYSFSYADPQNDNTHALTKEIVKIRNRAFEHLGFPDKVSDNLPL